ncbi:MAG: DivIVA domain-containing protein [Clostridia bacterium]|nr:DivIVA domain-containing protein [Clostridia bacterium]
MENSKLFQVCEQGYNCSQVDEYIAAVKSEYKKLYEYSKKLDISVKELREKSASVVEENEKLTQQSAEREKKILELETALSKAKGVTEKAPAPDNGEKSAEYEALLKSVSTMQILSEEVVRENKELRAKLEAIKAGL